MLDVARREIQWSEALIRWCGRLLIPTYLLIALALYCAFLYAPTERVMGEVQRIFYFHVGSAWNGFFAFFGVFLMGLLYLWKRDSRYDQIGVASVEVGVVFITIVLLTGPMWAKPVWGAWFPLGEPRLMTTLVMWLMYIAYLILRSSIPVPERRASFCAVFGIISFLNVPIVYKSVDWWRGMHPKVIGGGADSGLEPRMFQSLMLAVVACTALCLLLIFLRSGMRLNRRGTIELGRQLDDLERRRNR